MKPDQRVAIIIDPKPTLVDLVAEALRRMGFDVVTATTHAGGAAKADACGKVDLGIVAVRTPSEDQKGSYLLEARNANDRMGMVVMLSDPADPTDEAPPSAERIIKPFNFTELTAAVERATGASS